MLLLPEVISTHIQWSTLKEYIICTNYEGYYNRINDLHTFKYVVYNVLSSPSFPHNEIIKILQETLKIL